MMFVRRQVSSFPLVLGFTTSWTMDSGRGGKLAPSIPGQNGNVESAVYRQLLKYKYPVSITSVKTAGKSKQYM